MAAISPPFGVEGDLAKPGETTHALRVRVVPGTYPEGVVHELSDEERLRAWLLQDAHDGSGLSSEDQAVKDYLGGRRPNPPDDELVRALLPPSRRATGRDWAAARSAARDWSAFGFKGTAVSEWLRAGVEPGEAWLVDELVTEGISPQRASLVIEDPDSAERLTLVELARKHHSRIRPDQLGAVLDAAGVERVRLDRGPQWMRRWTS